MKNYLLLLFFCLPITCKSQDTTYVDYPNCYRTPAYVSSWIEDQNGLITAHDTVYYEAGLYFIYFGDSNTVWGLNITFGPKVDTGTVAYTLCEGDSLYLEGEWRKTNGTYFKSSINWMGCDTTTAVTLSFVPRNIKDTTIYLCGNRVLFRNIYYYTTGDRTLKIKNGTKCDDIIYLHVAACSNNRLSEDDADEIVEVRDEYGMYKRGLLKDIVPTLKSGKMYFLMDSKGKRKFFK